MEELAHRMAELETQCKMQDEDELAAEAARCTSLKVMLLNSYELQVLYWRV